jgi:hypothetical protein
MGMNGVGTFHILKALKLNTRRLLDRKTAGEPDVIWLCPVETGCFSGALAHDWRTGFDVRSV